MDCTLDYVNIGHCDTLSITNPTVPTSGDYVLSFSWLGHSHKVCLDDLTIGDNFTIQGTWFNEKFSGEVVIIDPEGAVLAIFNLSLSLSHNCDEAITVEADIALE